MLVACKGEVILKQTWQYVSKAHRKETDRLMLGRWGFVGQLHQRTGIRISTAAVAEQLPVADHSVRPRKLSEGARSSKMLATTRQLIKLTARCQGFAASSVVSSSSPTSPIVDQMIDYAMRQCQVRFSQSFVNSLSQWKFSSRSGEVKERNLETRVALSQTLLFVVCRASTNKRWTCSALGYL